MTGPEYKYERKRRDLSQVALAALVGVTQATISDRETGRREITQEAAIAIRSLPIPRKRPDTKGQNDHVQTSPTDNDQ